MGDSMSSATLMIGKFATAASKRGDIALVCLVIAIMALLILPVPILLIDMLLALGISTTLLMLTYSFYIRSPLELSAFPAILLFSTLFRIALDVAVTRAILVNGEAGQLVEIFGKMVAGGSLAIGLVVFAIITIVQFIVVAKGAERVAEVTARFTLDGLPGRQMSIDADLRNGVISESQARSKRNELERESQFHGSMDGAMKFVKGDVVASVVIVMINLLGGMAVGVLSRDMDVASAVEKYSVLSIGEGLLSQIPSMLATMAAAVLITRTAKDESQKKQADLGSQIIAQLKTYPQANFIVGVIAILFALLPGFPFWAFAWCGILMALISFFTLRQQHRGRTWSKHRPEFDAPVRREWSSIRVDTQKNVRGYAPLTVKIGPALLREIDADALQERYESVQRSVRHDWGVRLPELWLLPDASLGYRYEIGVNEMRRGSAEFDPSVLALAPGARLLKASGNGYFWLWQKASPSDVKSGSACGDVATAIMMHVDVIARAKLAPLTGPDEIMDIISSCGKEYVEMSRDVFRNLPLIRFAGLLRRLIAEGVPIHAMRGLLTCASLYNLHEMREDDAIEFMRTWAIDSALEKLADSEGRIAALVLGADLVEELRTAIAATGPDFDGLPLTPERTAYWCDHVRGLAAQHKSRFPKRVVIVADSALLRAVRTVFESSAIGALYVTPSEVGMTYRLSVVDQIASPLSIVTNHNAGASDPSLNDLTSPEAQQE
jgi:type III secretion protein V